MMRTCREADGPLSDEDKTIQDEANGILDYSFSWLRAHRDTDDEEGKAQQVRMILAVTLGMVRTFVSDDRLRGLLRAMSLDVPLWSSIAHQHLEAACPAPAEEDNEVSALGDNKDDPGECSCQHLTMVGHHTNEYWPIVDHRQSGHHPECQYYEPPPRFEYAKGIAKEILKEAGAVSMERRLAFAIYDLVKFLEKEFPDAKADGSS